MKVKSFNRQIVLISAILFLLSCNRASNSLEFKNHPAAQLLISENELQPNSGFWSIDWSTSSLLTLSVTGPEGNWPVFIGDIPADSLNPVNRKGSPLWSVNSKVSPNGEYMAYQAMQEPLGIYISALERESDNSFSLIREQLVIQTAVVSSLDWAYDSQRLAILTMTEAGFILSIYDLSNGNVQELLTYKEKNIDYVNGLSWSLDGEKLAFVLKYSVPTQDSLQVQSDIFVYSLEEDHLLRLTSSSKLSEAYPSWLPKEDILTYTSTPGMGGTLVGSELVFSAKDGQCTKVIPNLEGIASPSWSPDGSEIAFLSADGVEIINASKAILPNFFSVNGLCSRGKSGRFPFAGFT